MNVKTILMCAMALGGACAFGGGEKELTLGIEDGLPCELTLVEIPSSGDMAGFVIGKSEITQEQYEKVMGENPSTDKGAQLPVNNVTRAEAMKFCDRLNELVKRPNLKWALPTSNQWQRVARAGEKFEMCGSNGFRIVVVDTRDTACQNVVAEKLRTCEFLLNKDFKKNAKYYLCLFSASWCGPCRAEMPRIAKTYAETLKADPDIELIHFSRDQDDEKAMAWAKEHDVKFPVVKPDGGNPLDLRSRGIPHLFILKADGTLVEEGHPMRLFTEEKLRALKSGTIAVPETATEKTRKAVAKLFPGWSLDTEVYNHDFAGIQASHRGQDNVVFVHPKDQNTPAIISRTVKLSDKNPCLSLRLASANDDADFLLSVRVDGKDALTNRLICTPDAKPWEDIIIPLPAWRGSTAKVEIVFIANGWWNEFPYLARVEIAEGNGDMRIIEGKDTVNGYTWSYRAQNGEAMIVAENDGRFSAISPRPVGHITVPATLGGATVTHIGRDAFLDCSGLTSVAIPESVVRIGRGAFHDCTGLRSLKIPSGVRIIERDAFLGCTALTAITIPEGVASIERGAFYRCCGLESIVIPSSVKHIGTDAFRYCRGLTSVTIPQSVTDIGWQAFRGCNALTSMTIPASVTNGCNFAFCDMGAMTSFHVDEGNRFYKSENGLLVTKDGTTLVRGVNGGVTIPSSVTAIGTSAFEGCVALRPVVIPSGVKSIGAYAFKQCRGMAAVTIPESVTSIGREAFNNCSSLTSATIPASVQRIEQGAFHGCSGLESITIPATVTNIDKTAFNGCSNLKSVDVVKDGKVESMSMDEFWKSKDSSQRSRSNLLGGRNMGSLRERRAQRDKQRTEAEKTAADERAAREKERDETQKKLAEMAEELKRLRETVEAGKGTAETKTTSPAKGTLSVSEKLRTCEFLLNKDFKKNAKYYLCLFSASWCGPCRAEMSRIAKTYAETLKDDPDIELVHFSRDQDDEKAMAWAKEHDVKFPVVKPKGGNPLDLKSRGIPHLFILKADGTLVEEGHPAGLFSEEKFYLLMGKHGEKTVDGVTWSYSGRNGKAMIVSPTGKLYEGVVSPKPTGSVSVPSSVDGAAVTAIGKFAICKCPELISVKIPASVTSIGAWALSDCKKLSAVTIPASVTSIGECVFAGCSKLTEIGMDEENQTYTAVDGVLYTKDMKRLVTCPGGIESATIPSGVTDIDENAFRCCRELKTVTIASGVRRIGSDAFCATALTSIAIPSSVETIGNAAFWCCSRLKSVEIGDGVRSIGGRAFYQCEGLTSIVIPASVKNIAWRAFEDCKELTSVTMCGERPESRDGVFDKCKKLAAIHVPADAKSWAGMKEWQGIPLVFDAK